MAGPLVSDDTMIDGESEDMNEDMSPPESESEEDVKLAQPSKNAVYNRDAILDKLGDISWPENVEWIHKLSIDIDQEQEVDVNDDLTRELAFYTQALEGTRQAFEKLQSMGLPFLRPTDYYAEMVKTDSHMVKVKGKLLAEKKKMEEADERRKAREAKRLSKEVQAQKLKERAKQKKDDIESVKVWRKQRQQSGFANNGNDADSVFNFEDGQVFERSKKKRPGVTPGDRSGGKAGRPGGKAGGKATQAGGKGNKPPNREVKQSRFGFGGKKGMKKQNTADTTNDFSKFNKGPVAGNKRKR